MTIEVTIVKPQLKCSIIPKSIPNANFVKEKTQCGLKDSLIEKMDKQMASIIQCQKECSKLDSKSFSYGRSDHLDVCKCVCFKVGSKGC